VGAALLLGLEEDAPPIVRHPDVIEVRPAVGLDRHRGAQVDVALLPADRPLLLPPVDELRLPGLERALQPLVAREVDVVRDLLVGEHGGHDQVLFHWNCGRSGWPYSVSAPCSPVELARVKIQFCQADRRPKILVSRVSGPTKRSDCSMPVRASGDSEARSSIAMRSSSSKSMSSAAIVAM